MIFTRSVPQRHYRDYTRYRELLRHDFQYRCAYCLLPEFHNGGAANFCIDHFCPQQGAYGRPDLVNIYTNLYWSCHECNQNKADQWPSPQDEAMGFRWIDPCDPEGDHDLHWQISSVGEIHWLTPVGEYTVVKLRLHQREDLKAYWRRLYEAKQLRESLFQGLACESLSPSFRESIQRQIRALDEFLNPPVFYP